MQFLRKTLGTLLGALALSVSVAHAAPLATINSTTISTDEFKKVLNSLAPAQRENILKDVNARRSVLSQLIDQELLIQEGEREKLDKDAEFKAAYDQFRRQYLTNKILGKNLGAKMTEAAARSYYDRNKIRYTTDQAHVMHVLLDNEGQAREVLKLAQAPKADFQAIAEKYSKDPSAKNNRGDLGFVGKDQLVEEFTTAAFKASAGSVIGPVKTTYGYHVIKVVEKKTGRTLSYDEVELRVKNDLRQQLTTEYLARVRKTAKISIDERGLQQL